MPEIHAELDLPAEPDRVWAVVRAHHELAGRVPQVLEVGPAAGHDDATRWRVLLNGSEVTWTQVERVAPGPRLSFDLVDGDFESLSGQWTVVPLDGPGCRAGLTIRFRLGVDGLAPLLDPMWSQSLHAFANALLRAVAASVVRTPEEVR